MRQPWSTPHLHRNACCDLLVQVGPSDRSPASTLSLALAIAFAGCNGDPLTSPTEDSSPAAAPSFATSFLGGIPFGTFAQPTSVFGDRYNGATRNIYPENLLSELKAIKERGGKVVLNLAGAPPRYTDGSGNFSLTMWKASVDRHKNVDFSTYIQDGTVIGNFLIDEPNDPANWNGRPVPESTVEEMAEYSKSRWPGMPTIVRARPEYLTGTYRYLDAAWAQYHSRFGDPARFIAENVAQAKSKGLALVVGFNILKGNDGSKMTASQIESWVLKNSTLKTYKGFPHGMPTTEADTINTDLLAFIKQPAASPKREPVPGMIFDITTFTLIHTLISLVAIHAVVSERGVGVPAPVPNR
jgi:hypothetical protein